MQVRIENVSKYYQDKCVLKNISFDIGNEIIGLIGPSGAGKTTLLKIISNLDKDYSGKIIFNDKDTNSFTTSILIQDQELITHLNVFNNLSFMIEKIKSNYPHIDIKKEINDEIEILKKLNFDLSVIRKNKSGLIQDLVINNNITPTSIRLYFSYYNKLDRLEIKLDKLQERISSKEKRYLTKYEIERKVIDIAKITKSVPLLFKNTKKLSLGEKQRIKLSIALIKMPKLLLLDEPTSNLDPLLKQDIISNILNIHNNLHIPIIYVTHSFEEASEVCNKILILNNGELEQYDNPKNIISNPNSAFICSLSIYTKDNVFIANIKNNNLYFNNKIVYKVSSDYTNSDVHIFIPPDAFYIDKNSSIKLKIIDINLNNNLATIESNLAVTKKFKIKVKNDFELNAKTINLSFDKNKIIILNKY